MARKLIVRNAVGQTGPALVEHDEARERCQSFEKTCEGRLFPRKLHMRYPAGDVHEIEGAFADDLIRDVHVAAAGEAGPGLHGKSLPPGGHDRPSTALKGGRPFVIPGRLWNELHPSRRAPENESWPFSAPRCDFRRMRGGAGRVA